MLRSLFCMLVVYLAFELGRHQAATVATMERPSVIVVVEEAATLPTEEKTTDCEELADRLWWYQVTKCGELIEGEGSNDGKPNSRHTTTTKGP